jgi:mono/diheme cytochrome c family protein
MKIIWTIILAVILVLVVSAIAVYSGIYNVAATQHHSNLTEWVLNKTLSRSVEYHSRGINAPDHYDESNLKVGSVSYDEMCATCHGAPGVDPSVIGEGLYPEPPDLAKSVKQLTASQIFWITKSGLKMTGMPAFGPTHTDKELWEVVLFVQKLPDISPEDYADLTETIARENRGHEHDHSHKGHKHAESDNTNHHNERLEKKWIKNTHSMTEAPTNDKEEVHTHTSGEGHDH